MESRVERNKRIKIEQRNRRIKFFIIVICIMFFFTNLYIVDVRFREIMCISEKRICEFRIEDELYKLHLFGSDYIITKNQVDAYLDNVRDYMKQIYKLISEYKNKLMNN